MTDATRALAIAGAATAAAVALGLLLVAHPGPFAFDEPLGNLVQRLPPRLGQVASLPGDWRVAMPAALGLALLAWRLGAPGIALAAIGAEGARFLNHAWKALVERPRPGPDALAIHEVASGWSYPSGHASTAALVLGLLALLAFTRLRGAARWVVATAAILLVLATGAGRVITGAHWPSDVLGGWLAGGATAAVLVVLADRLTERRATTRGGRAEPGG